MKLELFVLFACILGSIPLVWAEYHHHTVSSPDVCGDHICQPISSGFDINKPKFEYIPTENIPATTSPNWSVTIHLPTFGNSDNSWVSVLSNDNFTALKQNVAIMNVADIHTTSQKATTNYCPLAKFILTHQGTPDYLNKIYNPEKNVDLTAYVYPKYCHIESGVNPINGDGSISVPEFPLVAELVVVFSIMFVVVLGRARR